MHKLINSVLVGGFFGERIQKCRMGSEKLREKLVGKIYI